MKGYIPEEKNLVLETCGYRIKYYRMQSGLTQKELAQRCGINESTIRNYELNNRMPDKNTLSKIAEALNVHYYALAREEIKDPEGAIHTLFHLEKLYGMHPEMINGKLCIVSETAVPQDEKTAALHRYLKSWLKEYDAVNKGTAENDYAAWQACFPS